MVKADWRSYQQLLKTLKAPAVKAILAKENSGDTPTPGVIMLMWTADLLSTTGIVDADQRNLILDTFVEQIKRVGEDAHKATYALGTLINSKLGIADRRYAIITGSKDIIDLQTGDKLQALPQLPLEEVYFNLTSLYLHQLAILQALDKGPIHDKHDQPAL